MQRIFKTPIRRSATPDALPKLRPFLELASTLNEDRRATGHSLRVVLARGAYINDSPQEQCMRRAEEAVRVPRRMPWLQPIVAVNMRTKQYHREVNQQVLKAFRDIEGADNHGITLYHLSNPERADGAYHVKVRRGNVDIVVANEQDEPTELKVDRVALAAAGLRLAVATTLMDTAPQYDRFAQDAGNS